jgi:uncharacterized protein YlxP (DUF503 family)
MAKIKVKRLTPAGYKFVNEMNEKYNISFFEITDTEDVEQWIEDFISTSRSSNIISTEDLNKVIEIRDQLYS